MPAALRMLGLLLAATALVPSPSPARAGSFAISPVRVELSRAAATGALTIRNQEAAPVVVQAELLAWDQADGEDRLAPTRDVLVSPAVFTLAAGGSQLVRVALRRDADPQRELSYRLLLTEVPSGAGPSATGLNVALRLSLPVFVAPDRPAAARVGWSASREAGGSLALTARNSGDAHARVLRFGVVAPGGDFAAPPRDVAAYILPGQSRTWILEGVERAPADGPLLVRGTLDSGDFETETQPGEP